MLTLIGKRLLQLIPTLFFVSVIIFSLQQLLPGDPAPIMAGEDKDPEVIEQIRHQYRLDQPLPVQYLYWVKGVLTGDLGESMRFKVPVLDLIAQKLPVTLQLAVMAMTIALVIGVSAGIDLRRQERHRLGLRGQRLLALGDLDAELLARDHDDPSLRRHARLAARIGLRAACGRIGVKASPRPSCPPSCSATPSRASSCAIRAARCCRRSERLRADRARQGLAERKVIIKHAMRNALTPIITLGALEFGTLLSGAVLTEQIFTIPGFGKLIVDAVFNRDYAVVQGVVLVTASTYIVLNLLADVGYILANPRLRA